MTIKFIAENSIKAFVKSCGGKVSYCKKAHCLGVGDLVGKEFTCRSCDWHGCYVCEGPFNSDHVCTNGFNLTEGNGMLDEERIKTCPTCNIYFFREPNTCPHMTCSVCRAEFCFICLAPFVGANNLCSCGTQF